MNSEKRQVCTQKDGLKKRTAFFKAVLSRIVLRRASLAQDNGAHNRTTSDLSAIFKLNYLRLLAPQ
ncbi:hypothetical protein BU251_07385 [Candidatus Velamenicoccus archaeovorus]|uniref:Uncharacterized protein n=1 Tax=Velamenicoccus archaeovorus TaxID=1930593 RepID=A0A410P654_VELA1|nr:hypothetical protein BU251_07385 [Candidatus Velamenicoccus archaeovorus]